MHLKLTIFTKHRNDYMICCARLCSWPLAVGSGGNKSLGGHMQYRKNRGLDQTSPKHRYRPIKY